MKNKLVILLLCISTLTLFGCNKDTKTSEEPATPIAKVEIQPSSSTETKTTDNLTTNNESIDTTLQNNNLDSEAEKIDNETDDNTIQNDDNTDFYNIDNFKHYEFQTSMLFNAEDLGPYSEIGKILSPEELDDFNKQFDDQFSSLITAVDFNTQGIFYTIKQSNSGSINYTVDSLIASNDGFMLQMNVKEESGDIGTCDMCTWFFACVLDKQILDDTPSLNCEYH